MASTSESESSESAGLLRSQEGLDDEEIGDFLDAGYSPPERPLGIGEWGVTAREALSHEDLDHRLAREVGENAVDEGDGIGDASDTDGELIDDEVGDERAGRLLAWDTDVTGGRRYDGYDYWAHDVGIDGGAASAEEAAVHIVPDAEDQQR
ncbi:MULTISPECIES: DUF5709 domain-containing protein [unclassified Streptomyces]|uniref:DUF5709 domain-containing protein n=1 Tax=unclassified Streptomyces TaxID=2593676 RepID=UPI002E180CE1